MSAGWTETRIATLKTLWSEGLSCSQIANRLGGGVSRNAVIGKAHRLGLSRRRQVNASKRFYPNRQKHHDFWTAARDADLAERFNRGQTKKTICQAIGCGPSSLDNRLKHLGLYRDPPKQLSTAKIRRYAHVEIAEARPLALIESPNARPWLERRRNECAWPLGERGAIRSCCNPVAADGLTYCVEHASIGLAQIQPAPLVSPRRASMRRVSPPPAPKIVTPWDEARAA